MAVVSELTWQWVLGAAIVLVITWIISNVVASWINKLKLRHLETNFNKIATQDNAIRVPVTIVTGFLGSGKTVLLNRLLANPGSRRICVIENEAGSVSIDHALLRPGDADPSKRGIVVLKNGCMCCSSSGSGDELSRTLDRLISLTDDGSASTVGRSAMSSSTLNPVASLPFSHIVIETSGMVDPAPLVQTFYRCALANSRYQLDSVIAVVDSKHIGHHMDGGSGFLSRSQEAGQQIAYADTVLLNKIDIASKQEQEAAMSAIRSLNPVCEVVETSYCNVSTEKLMDVRAFDVSRAGRILQEQLLLPMNSESTATGSNDTPPSDGLPDAVASYVITRGRHTSGIAAVTIPLDGVALSSDRLVNWLRQLVQHRWRSLFRIKGLMYVFDGNGSHQHDNMDPPQQADAASQQSSWEGLDQLGAAVEAQAGDDADGAYLFVVHGVHAEIQGSRVDTDYDSRNNNGGPDHHGDGASGSNLRHGAHDHDHGRQRHPHLHPALVLIGRDLDEAALRHEFQQHVLRFSRRYNPCSDTSNSCCNSHSNSFTPPAAHDTNATSGALAATTSATVRRRKSLG